jgi:hypothetical protein
MCKLITYKTRSVAGWLFGDYSMIFMGFWDLQDNIYEYVCYCNRCHGNALKGFWALWDNVYEYVLL